MSPSHVVESKSFFNSETCRNDTCSTKASGTTIMMFLSGSSQVFSLPGRSELSDVVYFKKKKHTLSVYDKLSTKRAAAVAAQQHVVDIT